MFNNIRSRLNNIDKNCGNNRVSSEIALLYSQLDALEKLFDYKINNEIMSHIEESIYNGYILGKRVQEVKIEQNIIENQRIGF